MKKTTTANNTNEAETKGGIQLESFFILEQANAGKKLALTLPDGTETPYHLTVVSRHSDVAAKALEDFNTQRLLNASRPESDRVPERELRLPMLAKTVIAWDLPEDFNEANVTKLLRNAPQIADGVNRFIWNDASFFGFK